MEVNTSDTVYLLGIIHRQVSLFKIKFKRQIYMYTKNNNRNFSDFSANGNDGNNGNGGNNNNRKDKFAHLKSIASGQAPAPTLSSDIRFWTHEPRNPLIGTILGFDQFEHEAYGRQDTVIVEREDGEVVSAILTPYLQKGMTMQNGDIGDAVLIEKQGQERSQKGKVFNKFLLVVDKQ